MIFSGEKAMTKGPPLLPPPARSILPSNRRQIEEEVMAEEIEAHPPPKPPTTTTMHFGGEELALMETLSSFTYAKFITPSPPSPTFLLKEKFLLYKATRYFEDELIEALKPASNDAPNGQ